MTTSNRSRTRRRSTASWFLLASFADGLVVPSHYHHQHNHHPHSHEQQRRRWRCDPRARSCSSALRGRAWDALGLSEEDPLLAEPRWYLLNCVAGLENDLLAQCNDVKRHHPDDMVRFAVPTSRQVRSHGKRNVVDEIVLHPGYVFAEIRLCEETYESLSGLVNCRAWTGTIRKVGAAGYRKLPSVPAPLGDEEIERFRLLEEELERETAERTVEDMLAVYSGLEVEDMVKVLSGKHAGEDGIVKRLKAGRVSVRLYTYGTQFDEWMEPEQIRPLTELELMRGLGGRDTPLRQNEFDRSIGRNVDQRDDDQRGRPRGRDDDHYGGYADDDDRFSKRNQRRGLMANVKGGRNFDRNRREDRVNRGDTSRNIGRASLEQEQTNWEDYKNQEANRKMRSQIKDQQQKQQRQRRRDDDFAASDVDSQWGRGGRSDRRSGSTYSSFEDDDDDYDKDDGKDAGGTRDDDFFSDLMSELGVDLADDDAKRTYRDDDDARGSSSSAPPTSSAEDDFFSSLVSELSSSSSPVATTDDGPPAKETRREDDFFANLERDMGDESGDFFAADSASSPPPQRTNADQQQTNDVDDFFSDLEREMSSSTADDDDDSAAVSDDDDDFFAALEREAASSLSSNDGDGNDDDQGGLSEDDFFAMLERDMESLSSTTQNVGGAPTPSAPTTTTTPDLEKRDPVVAAPAPTAAGGDLSKLTVPVLKSMLKERGLKVSGKKAELIERLGGG